MKILRRLNPQFVIFIAFVFLTVVWITLRLPTVSQALMDADSGHQLAGATQILHGQHPFIDFEATYGPLTFYASALAQLVFFQRFIGEIVLCMAGYALAYGLLALLIYRVTGKVSLTFLFGVLALLAMPRLYKYYIVLGPVLTAWCAWLYIDQPRLRNIFWLALAVLIAGLFRSDAGVYCAIAATIAVVFQPAPLVATLKRMLILWGEVLLLALPWLLFLTFKGGLQRYFYDAVTGGVNIATGMSLSFPSFQIDQSLFSDANLLFVLALFFCSFPFVGLLWLALSWRTHETRQRQTLLVILVLSALSLTQAFSRLDIAHLSQVMPLVFLLGAWLAGRLTATFRPSSVLALVIVAIFLLAGRNNWSRIDVSGIPERVGQFTLSKNQMLFNINKAQHLGYSTMMLYIRRCTSDSQRLMALPALTTFPYYTDRAFGGGQIGIVSGYFVTQADQQRILAKMKQEDIPLIVNLPDFAFDNLDVRKMDVVAPAVTNYIQANYHSINKIGQLELLLRNDLTVKQPGAGLGSFSCPVAGN